MAAFTKSFDEVIDHARRTGRRAPPDEPPSTDDRGRADPRSPPSRWSTTCPASSPSGWSTASTTGRTSGSGSRCRAAPWRSAATNGWPATPRPRSTGGWSRCSTAQPDLVRRMPARSRRRRPRGARTSWRGGRSADAQAAVTDAARRRHPARRRAPRPRPSTGRSSARCRSARRRPRHGDRLAAPTAPRALADLLASPECRWTGRGRARRLVVLADRAAAEPRPPGATRTEPAARPSAWHRRRPPRDQAGVGAAPARRRWCAARGAGPAARPGRRSAPPVISWPWEAPAAREMFSSMSVPPRSLQPACSSWLTPSRPIFTQLAWTLSMASPGRRCARPRA